MSGAVRGALALGLALLAAFAAGPAAAQERALVLPHIEGERQGRIVGEAAACGADEATTQAALRLLSERMRARVGQTLWQDRFLPEFNDALRLGAQVPPGDCAKALAALTALMRE
ncbi:hypothetical protein [Methylobacterium isbiliense]|uniref:hypothetical protein n=1 Tax=Methylobacterium isbiliense TaxID=315478 RepID=UPI0025B2FFE9|nr:hypothetical protein [Methylobacterium isbiliense]MDN3626303.1 hypothetical protein [Methylobacterium isbiliense]